MRIQDSNIQSSGSFTSSVFESFYPNGQLVVESTTTAINGVSRERTLTTRTLSDAFSGDALYRSPRYAATFYNNAISSSLNSMITGGSETAFLSKETYSTADPEGISNSATLTGGLAFARAIGDGVMGKKAGQEFARGALNTIANQTAATFAAAGSGNLGIDGVDLRNGEVDTSGLNTPAASSGSRHAVISTTASEQEIGWIKERGAYLRGLNCVTDGALINGFNFDIINEYQTNQRIDGVEKVVTVKLTDLVTTGNYWPNGVKNDKVPVDLIQAPSQTAYISPSLIELLIFLASKIRYKGGLGAGRTTAGKVNGNFVSDHTFGRAIDLSYIGALNSDNGVSLPDTAGDKEKFKYAVELLLSAINVAPVHLIPDSIVISDQMKTDYGISDNGKEDANIPLFKMFPNLKYVNFRADTSHRNHIHVSFCPSRSGIYSGPNGELNGVLTVRPPSSGPPQGGRPGDTGAGTVPGFVSVPGVNQPDAAYGDPAATRSSATGKTFLEYISNVSFAQYAKDMRLVTGVTAMGTSVGGINEDYSTIDIGELPAGLDDPVFTKNYLNAQQEALTPAQTFKLLTAMFLPDEPAAIMTAIAERESNWRPACAYFDRGNRDFSIGLFQANMLTYGERLFMVPGSNEPELGWKLAYKNWQRDGFTSFQDFLDNALDKSEAIDKSQWVTLCDPRIWTPIFQAGTAYSLMTGKPFAGERFGSDPEKIGYLFYQWGDYGKRYGLMSGGVKFSVAAACYQTTGKPVENLKSWIKKHTKGPGGQYVSKDYVDDWVEGVTFGSKEGQVYPSAS